MIFDAALDPRSSIRCQSSFYTRPGYASLPACSLGEDALIGSDAPRSRIAWFEHIARKHTAARSEHAFASQCSTAHDCTLEAMRTQLHSHRAAKTPRAYSSILNIAKADECNYIACHHET